MLRRAEDVSAGTANIFEYDDNDNVAVIRDRFHRVLGKFTYDGAGNVLTRIDGVGNVSSYTYDALNRVVTATDPDGGTVRFAYDAMGNILSVTDPGGKITSFEYDPMDRVVKRTDTQGNAETYAYDENGNLIGRTDRNGNRIRYSYDVLDRLIGENYPDGTGLEFAYDAVGNIVKAVTPHVTNTYDYDSGNRLTRAFAGGILPGVYLSYEYDKNANLTELDDTESASERVTYRYDANYNLTKVRSRLSGGTFADWNVSYDSAQRRSKITYPNGIAGNYAHVPGKENQLKNLTYKSGNRIVSSFDYDYNLNDFVTRVDMNRGGIGVNTTRNYVYDKRNQLVSATKTIGTGNETFTYDKSGNRLRQNGETTNSTFDNNNRLLNDKKFTYEYDNNGNRTKRTNIATGEILEYSWDYRNRLIRVVKRPSADGEATSTVTYRYDAFDRRVEKNVNGTITRFVHERDNIHLEYDGENGFKAKYVHSDRVDEVLRMVRPDTPYRDDKFPVQEFWFHRNRIGSVTEITDYAGTVVQRYVYDAFGKVTIYDKEGNVITPESPNYLENPFTFTGREYDPETGSFISGDPIGFAGRDANLYRYVGNNPINFVDPRGKIGFLAVAAIAGVTSGVFSSATSVLITGNFDNAGSAFVSGFIGGAVGTALGFVGPVGGVAAVLGKVSGKGFFRGAGALLNTELVTKRPITGILSGVVATIISNTDSDFYSGTETLKMMCTENN